MNEAKPELLRGTLDMLILKIVALGPSLQAQWRDTDTGREAKFYAITK